MKKELFKKTYSVEKVKHTPTFEEYVHKTSKLIKRSYMQTFKLVEDWQTHTIIRRYNECMEYKGEIPKNVLWWWKRRNNK